MKSQLYHMPTSEVLVQVIYSNICHESIVIYIIFNELWSITNTTTSTQEGILEGNRYLTTLQNWKSLVDGAIDNQQCTL